MEKIYGNIPRMENNMLVSELESKLAKLPQNAQVKIRVGDSTPTEIKEIMYEDDVYDVYTDFPETLTLIG